MYRGTTVGDENIWTSAWSAWKCTRPIKIYCTRPRGIATRAVRARSAWVLEVTSWGRGTNLEGGGSHIHTHRRGPRDPRTECVGFGGKFIGAWHELEGAA